jgi:DNA-binding response OmpR family regulator
MVADKKPHILLIDDDETVQRLFGAKLSKEGFEPIYAHDGDSGREMARRLLPNLILLDLRMPNVDGYEIARLLKTEKETKDIPLALFTNEDLAMEAQKWMKDIGVIKYFHKSMDLNEFISEVKKIVYTEITEGV